jgi:hypothetical protein
MRYTDDEDPVDTTAGLIVDVVKHIKSGKLQFKAYDDSLITVHGRRHTMTACSLFTDRPPTDKLDFVYLNVAWAMKSCRFHKPKAAKPFFAKLASAVSAEESAYNLGTPSASRRKLQQQRRRSRIEWYRKLPLRANSAVSVAPRFSTAAFDLAALSAIDLNPDGTRLTSTSALNGPDRPEWLIKYGEEIERLITSGTGTFIRRPAGKTVAYYNPQTRLC